MPNVSKDFVNIMLKICNMTVFMIVSMTKEVKITISSTNFLVMQNGSEIILCLTLDPGSKCRTFPFILKFKV